MKTNKNAFLKNGLVVFFTLLTTVLLNTKTYAATYDPVIPDGQAVYIKNTDGSMIPDKYNTGLDPAISLTAHHPSDGSFTINGLRFTGRADMNEIQLDFFNTPNLEDGAVYTIENVDFSDSTRLRFTDYHNFSDSGKHVKVIFKNCKFSGFSNEDATPLYSFEFYDCDFLSAAGYNLTFERCQFHPTSGDGMNPHGHVTVKNSYFYFVANPLSSTGHLDGFQTFGRAVADMEAIHFDNVRIEIPKNKVLDDNGEWYISSINAAIMLSVEYSANAHDVLLENMIVNGGGYTIYMGCSRDCQYLSDVTFRNIKVGYAHMFGIMYPNHGNTEQASIDGAVANSNHITSLYAGSAWKNSRGVHLSVSNDMTSERIMTCSIDGGVRTTHQIPAHPVLTQRMDVADVPTYDQFPYDLDIVVANSNATTIDCYDTTDDTNLATAPLVRSIRFESSAAPTDPTNPTEPTNPSGGEPSNPSNPSGNGQSNPSGNSSSNPSGNATQTSQTGTGNTSQNVSTDASDKELGELPAELPETGGASVPFVAVGGGIVAAVLYCIAAWFIRRK